MTDDSFDSYLDRAWEDYCNDPADEFDAWCEANPEEAAKLFGELEPVVLS